MPLFLSHVAVKIRGLCSVYIVYGTKRQVAISILQVEIYNCTHFPAGTTGSFKSSMGCVIEIVCHGGNSSSILGTFKFAKSINIDEHLGKYRLWKISSRNYLSIYARTPENVEEYRHLPILGYSSRINVDVRIRL